MLFEQKKQHLWHSCCPISLVISNMIFNRKLSEQFWRIWCFPIQSDRSCTWMPERRFKDGRRVTWLVLKRLCRYPLAGPIPIVSLSFRIVWKHVWRHFCALMGLYHKCDGTHRGRRKKNWTCFLCWSREAPQTWHRLSCTMTHYTRWNDWILYPNTHCLLRIQTTPYVTQIMPKSGLNHVVWTGLQSFASSF